MSIWDTPWLAAIDIQFRNIDEADMLLVLEDFVRLSRPYDRY